MSSSKTNIDAIIFDLTRTLIDIRESQNRVIELTVNNYLKKTAVTTDDIRRIKGVIGFNNEWDTTYALARMILEHIPNKLWEKEAQKLLPVDRTDQLFQELYDMFQTCYLGSMVFQKMENRKPPFPYSPGLITLEKSFIKKDLVSALKKKGYKLAIATGCPRQEVFMMLEQQGLLGKDYFEKSFIVGREDAKGEKPDPAPLLEAKRRLMAINPIFIGDSISDVEAARRAGMPCIFLGDQLAGTEPNGIINQIVQMFL